MALHLFEKEQLTTPAGGHDASDVIAASAVGIGAALKLNIEGPVSAASVRGNVSIEKVSKSPAALDLSMLWRDGSSMRVPRVFELAPGPWQNWQLDVECRTVQPVALADGSMSADLRLLGKGSSPTLTGTAHVIGAQAFAGANVLLLEDAALTFHLARPEEPSLNLRATGSLSGHPFTTFAVGPLAHLLRWSIIEAPLTETIVRKALARSATDLLPGNARFSLRAPPIMEELVHTYHWSDIHLPVVHSENHPSAAEFEAARVSGTLP